MNDIRLLVVDDEVHYLETLIKRLKKRKLDADSTVSPIDALAKIEREEFDVVVLDVKMPEMDGIEALGAIKKSKPLTEVIILTGHANLESAVKGMELGAFAYMIKPVDIDELIYKIQDAYKKRVLEKQKRSAGTGNSAYI
ncbi:MAG: response regulator [Candidatus Magnetoovum sp. WYHC-5]|nr:response regulator [Candidatus Magnetoovum sp. WYHC-5]